jgi:ribosomal protein S18 acetylase RimI-like enzyme
VTVDVQYSEEPSLTADEFIDVLRRSSLAERRPVDDRQRVETMLRNADVICTARRGAMLVGVARAITDFCYCTYLSDLAVDRQCQRQGIGRELIQRIHRIAGLQTRLLLISAPAAQSYYPHLGMVRHESCWMFEPSESS